MCKSFCHLHNHSEFSLLDGANRIGGMVKRAVDLDMEAIALTDHGVMFGAMNFYWACKDAGVKPIIGMEAYITPSGIAARKMKETYHLLLLAKDIEGYRNLCKLATIAALEGFYGKPRIDHDILRKHSAGLISSTTCLGSEINQALLNDDYRKAREITEMYTDIFGPENFYVELQNHGLAEQIKILPDLRQIAKELKLPSIVTNDAHYGTREDAEPHDLLLCIQTGARVADEKRMRFETNEFYLKTQQEMADLFPEDGEALEWTAEIAKRCNVELDKQRAPMPQPDVPSGMESGAYLRQLCEQGLVDRKRDDEVGRQRLEYELDIINRCGFNDYMLLVREFAQATRDRGIYFGVRGSAAGSLVAYVTGVTDVDPVDYDLTFERFLNPERVSMPDIDMDFEDERRGEIIDWVTERYGNDRVAQIITFGTMGAKAAVRDCGRALGYEPKDTDALAKKIPGTPKITLEKARDENPEFREAIEFSERNRELYDMALHMEGRARNVGVHAAGIVISREPLVDYVPLYRGTEGQAVTSYEMKVLEKMGMLKMDFLGLSNLSVLAKTVASIEATTGKTIDVNHLPEDDEATWEMLARGESTGVFQLEGEGMTRYLVQLKPVSIRELAAMIALYRPGPLKEIPNYIDLKFGRKQPNYLDERMEPILRETYGVIVYQDQVLRLVQTLAGFSLGKADLLRRAMGKKDAKGMAKLEGEFFEGTAERGIAKAVAQEVWQLLIPFSDYAFNKAHSVCYAILSFRTAYLKANYPHEYMAALLATYREKEDRIVAFIDECRRRKIPVLRPDVNHSLCDARVQMLDPNLLESGKKGAVESTKAIRFGLGALKGVGVGLVQAVVDEREKNGPYIHLYEFAERTKPYGMNRTALEALVKAGALDGIDGNRKKLLEHIEAALMFADQRQRDKMAGQDSLFDGGGEEKVDYPALPNIAPAERLEILAMEKEAMGVYLSDHPLRGLESVIGRAATANCSAVEELPDGTPIKLAGIISALRITHSKRSGEPMCGFTLEDFSGQTKMMAFSNVYTKFRPHFVKDAVVRIGGRVRHRERGSETEIEIMIDDVAPLDTSERRSTLETEETLGKMVLTIPRATMSEIRALQRLVRERRGDYRLQVVVEPTADFAPIDLPFYVPNDSDFQSAVKGALPKARIEVRYSERAFA